MTFRPKARAGLWVTTLLPLAILANFGNFTHLSSKIMGNLALFLTLHNLHFALHFSIIPYLKKNGKSWTFAIFCPSSKINLSVKIDLKMTLISVMIMTSINLVILRSGIFAGFLCIFGYLAMAYFLPIWFSTFKASFSYGEGCLVLQSLILFIVKTVLSVFFDEHDPSTVDGSFGIIANVGLGSLMTLCIASFLPFCRFIINKSTAFYASGASLIFGFSIPYLWFRLKRNPINWLLFYISGSPKLLSLFGLWAACGILAVLLVMKQKSKATTAIRKYFHAIVVIVFTSGIIVDVNFLYLSSIVSLSIMVLLEFMRFKKIEPVADVLKNAFKLFQDEKDQGDLILTNIYLLSGVALPLWISPGLSNKLSLMSGILSIGIGDACASIVGSKLGKIKIFGTQKSLEGVIASVLSQIAFMKSLECFYLINEVNYVILTPMIITVSLVEAVTTQVDNIVLPLLMYIFTLFLK